MTFFDKCELVQTDIKAIEQSIQRTKLQINIAELEKSLIELKLNILEAENDTKGI